MWFVAGEYVMNINRRSFIQGTGAGTLLSTLPVRALAKNSDATTTSISTFEDGIEGWRTNGGNDLGRVSAESFGGVVEGSYGLAVLTQRDAYPMIENTDRVPEADFVSAPYLVADALPAVADSGSNVTFQFRLHHKPTEGNGKGKSGGEKRNGNGRNKDPGRPRVVSSPPIGIPQYRKSQLSWDLSNVSEDVRANATRLELRWHLGEETPERGPRGNQHDYDYQGYTVFDSFRLTDDPTKVSTKALSQTMTNMRLEHGVLTSTEVNEERAGYESGVFRFSDGTTIDYRFEQIGEEKYKYTIGDTEYKLGGGW